MKLRLKILILSIGFIGLSLITNDVIAQDTIKVTASSVYNDIKHAAEVNSPKIGNAISSIARGLKVTADQVWYILVKQQKVWSFCYLILTIAALCNWAFFWRKNYIKYKPEEYYTTTKKEIKKIINDNYQSYYSNTNDPRGQRYIDGSTTETEVKLPLETSGCSIKNLKYVHLTICIVLSVLSFLHFEAMLTGFLNPEYGAMKTIAQVAQSLK